MRWLAAAAFILCAASAARAGFLTSNYRTPGGPQLSSCTANITSSAAGAALMTSSASGAVNVTCH
jgi:hypothetical protein